MVSLTPTALVPGNPAAAAPAWRQFSFFASVPPSLSTASAPLTTNLNTTPTPEVLLDPLSKVSLVHSTPSINLVLVANEEGTVHVLGEDEEVARSWRAFGEDTEEVVGKREGKRSAKPRAEGRVTHIVCGEGKWTGLVLTVGEETTSAFPIIKIWDLSPNPSAPLPVTSSATQTSMIPAPILLRSSVINPPSSSKSSHPVTALAVSPGLEYVVLGLGDGTVGVFKGLDRLLVNGSTTGAGKDMVLGLGKFNIIHQTNDPITSLQFSFHHQSTSSTSTASTKKTTALFICTTSHIISFPISAMSSASISSSAANSNSRSKGTEDKSKNKKSSNVIDDLGSGIGCSTFVQLEEDGKSASDGGGKLIVARDEAIYVYGEDGREGCLAFEGPKSSIRSLSSSITANTLTPSSRSKSTSSSYVAIISPPVKATAASNSATIRNYANNSTAPTNEMVAKLTIFDLKNKFVAFTATFQEGICEIWEAWGSIWVLTETGKFYRINEQPIANSLSTLFSRNLYTLAVSLAVSRGLSISEIGEIYRRYGDHLYGKGDYEGAMDCYLKTVGTVQASYVIRKFLDAQRLSHLTSYLQELHKQGRANSDHTTLLLNCYTKLADDTSLSSFIHSSSTLTKPNSTKKPPDDETDLKSDEPPFNLETAIRVCRQAGYYDHAAWLASQYHSHEEYLRIQIEDRKDFLEALNYLRRLGAREVGEGLVRYGKVLMGEMPKETTNVLVDLCCGTLGAAEHGSTERKEDANEKGNGNGGEKGYRSYLAYALPSSNSAETSNPPPSPLPSSFAIPDSTKSSRPPSAAATARPIASSAATTILASNRKSGIDTQYQTPPSITSSDEVQLSADLPSPRQFFAHFIDHPDNFIDFLETIAKRRWGKSLDETMGDGGERKLEDPVLLRVGEIEEGDKKDEQAVWNTLLELYLSSPATVEEGAVATRGGYSGNVLRRKALLLLRSREMIPYDETQALLVCTTAGFVDGFILLYEQLGMYEDIIRYWIDSADPTSPTPFLNSAKIITALYRYGPSRPELYRTVLRYLTTSAELVEKHSGDIIGILEDVERRGIMKPIKVVQILSCNGTASVGLVREYLRRQLSNEKLEIESDRGLINSYRTETVKKQKEIQELADPNVPRIFQVTRCSACGGQLDLPSVHFMCRHSYHQRCLAENETQCPNCAREHGIIREIRKNNQRFAGDHSIFLEEVAESEDGFATVATAYGKGIMGVHPDSS